MTYSLTIFKHTGDIKTNKRIDFTSWDKFEQTFYGLASQPKPNKKSAHLISPAIYYPGTTRANKNVIEWAGWCAIDVDNHDFKGDLENELYSRYGNWRYICYSTASSTIAKPKFRLVFELKSPIPADIIRQFWYALNSEFEFIGDKQCKDFSRMYYVPATYANANNFIFSNKNGIPIDPNSLIAKHPLPIKQFGASFMDRLPDEVQQKIINYRKQSLYDNNKSISWSSYRDCPFINKKMIDEFKSIANQDGSGRYAMVYKIMTSIAVNAIRKKYPITANEIAQLIRELDSETTRKYENRPLDVEADRAIEFAYKNM